MELFTCDFRLPLLIQMRKLQNIMKWCLLYRIYRSSIRLLHRNRRILMLTNRQCKGHMSFPVRPILSAASNALSANVPNCSVDRSATWIIIDLQNCNNKTDLTKLQQQFKQIQVQTQATNSASQGFFGNLKSQVKSSIATMLQIYNDSLQLCIILCGGISITIHPCNNSIR